MSEMMENKLTADELDAVSGGVGRPELNVISITPYWVKVTASTLNGPKIKSFEYGHKLKVDGITDDGQWYRLLVNDTKHGGQIYGFIFKAYTERL